MEMRRILDGLFLIPRPASVAVTQQFLLPLPERA